MFRYHTLDQIENGITKYPLPFRALIARDQWTGLTDKHGACIYEGDIIHNSIAGNFLVEFKNGTFGYKSPGGFGMLYLFPTSDCEIIGNVHRNPECRVTFYKP